MTKLISAFPEWANYRVIAIAEDGTVYQIRLTEDGLAGDWTRIANGIVSEDKYEIVYGLIGSAIPI